MAAGGAQQQFGRCVRRLTRLDALLTVLVVLSRASVAADLSVGVQLGATTPVSQPQRSQVGLGGEGRLGVGVQLFRIVDLRLSGEYAVLPPTGLGVTRAAAVVSGEVGLRFRLPFTADRPFSPFVSVQGGGGLSGLPVVSAGASAGVLWRPNLEWTVGVGAHFTQYFAFGSIAGQATSNASMVGVGLIAEFSLSQLFLRSIAREHVELVVAKRSDSIAPVSQAPVVSKAESQAPVAAKPSPAVVAVVARPSATQTPPPVVFSATKIELRQKIHFKPGSVVIEKSSDVTLGDLEQALQSHPEVCVRIEGHTDRQGDAFMNLELSAGRAEAVRDALVVRKVESKRLTPRGFGSTVPIANNVTPAGREKNRRVEFSIVPCSAKRASR